MKKEKKCNIGLYFCAFLVFIFAPFELYLSNIQDLWFTIYDFGGYLLLAFLCSCLFIYLWELLAHKYFSKIWDAIATVLFFLGVALYIQGNFILANYGQMDGQPIVWDNFKTEGMISVGLFVILLIVAIVLLIRVDSIKLKKALNTVAVCLLLVQAFTLCLLFFTQNGMQRKDNYVVTSDAEWNYSKKDNFNVVVLDAFDSRVFYNLLNGEQGEEIKEIFKDFNYYRNTTTVYNLTDFSIPQILTGQGYKNESLYGDYLNEAYANSPFLNELKEKDYQMNLYTKITVPQGEEVTASVNNWKKMRLTVSSHRRLLTYLYQLVGFRYLPQPLKQSCWFYPDEMDDMRQVLYMDHENEDMEEQKLYDWDNKMFYDGIENMTVTEENSVLHFYHIKGLHVIRDLDANLQYAEDVSLEESAKAMFKIMDKYLKALKEQGVYDNSVIIFMADHAANEYEEKMFKQCPLLLIKGKNESHDFQINEIPVSYADLQTAFHNLLNQENEENIFEIEETKNRDRFLYQAGWIGGQLQTDSHSEDFYEYKISGDAFDSDSIHETGERYTFKED